MRCVLQSFEKVSNFRKLFKNSKKMSLEITFENNKASKFYFRSFINLVQFIPSSLFFGEI